MDFGSIDLNTVWFALVGVLLTGYAILDGFDLGLGSLHLFTKDDQERRVLLNSIAPVWDGNEVWLLTGGGALFAAFPMVYATVFSGFYLALVLLLVALIFRAVSIECRSKQPMAWWRQAWDVAYSVGSMVAALLFGVAIGNIAWGIPLDAQHEFAGSFLGLLHPYALLIGISAVAFFMVHGGLYGLLKTEGTLHEKMRGWLGKCIPVFIACYVLTVAASILWVPNMTHRFRQSPWLFVILLVNVLAVLNIPREVSRRRPGRAFLSSCVIALTVMLFFCMNMYPNLVLSNPDAANSLNIHNASSSSKTLGVMFTIALVGMPLVLIYTSVIYWIFRGKVRLDKNSY